MSERRPLAQAAEVSAYLGVDEKTLTNWRYLRRGPRWTKVGKLVRYAWSDVDEWLSRNSGGGAAA